MDTPERNKIGTPISKFERSEAITDHLAFNYLLVLNKILLADSPVFNYINSLSPIKPVKSIHITQTFNSLTFASIPSIFTSPHVSSHKESRFLRRHQFSDPSKLKFLSENGNKDCTNEVVVVDASQLSAELQENFDPGISIGEASAEQPRERAKFPIELLQNLNYDCGSPDCNQTPCGIETSWVSELARTSASLVPFVQKVSEKGSSEGEHLPGICQNEQKKEGSEREWESLFSDAADLLIFDFQNDMEDLKGLIQKSLDPGVTLCTPVSELLQGVIEDVQTTQLVDPVGSGEMENSPSQTGEAIQLKEMDQTQENLAITNRMASKQSEKVGDELVSNLHRGMRRRCLDFEMVGVRRKDLADGSNCSSSMILQSDEKITSNDKQLVAIKSGSDSSRSILPGIGLHLNALTKNSKDYKNAENETFSSERQHDIPSSSASFHFPTSGQETLHKSLASVTSERDADPTENGLQLVVHSSEASAYLASEEFNQSSPKRKRRRLENAGESEACKRCNCKKSKCLKLYCECFAAGVYCIEPCSCLECFNKPIHEDTVLATRKQIESRNPLAFAPKVIRSSDSVPEIGVRKYDESITTPASARHKRGCNCKKSSCLKKYCECFQGGVGCSVNCRCEGCKNAFGRKDGSAPIGTELEPEDEETETCEKKEVDNNLQKTEIQNNEEHNPTSALPTTPLQLCRPLLQLPFSTKGKPPRTSSLANGSSSGLHPIHKFVKPNFYRPPPNFENHFQTVPEDEMPDILRGNCSPSTGTKTASPNSKRVSPPHYDFGSSPGRRSGRKLILKSIPSFPSLTPQH